MKRHSRKHTEMILLLLPVLLATQIGCHRSRPDASRASNPNRFLTEPATIEFASAAVADGTPGSVFVHVVERTFPAVVSVASTRPAKRELAPAVPFDDPFFRRFFGPGSDSEATPFPSPPGRAPDEHALGSGVIVGKDMILTNAHVVEGASDLKVTGESKRVIAAKVVGTDPKSDLAVLKISGDTSGLSWLEFADSALARPGEIVLAIGNPFGVGETVTMGIVSAKGRADLGIAAYEDFIQTDAAINPGNSGGALVNLEGKLLGIPTAILSRSGGYMGVGFAIPSNMAKPIMASLITHGRVSRGYLGVSIQNVDADLAKALGFPSANGVLISDVAPSGPAAKAGIQRGDVVISIDGQPVQSTGELRNRIAAAGGGKVVRVEVLRGSKRLSFDAKLDDVPADDAVAKSGQTEASPSGLLGFSVAPLDRSARRRLKVPDDVRHGLVVAGVDAGGPAAHAGVQAGDVIVEINRKPAENVEQLAQAIGPSGEPAAVLIFRDGRMFYVVLKR